MEEFKVKVLFVSVENTLFHFLFCYLKCCRIVETVKITRMTSLIVCNFVVVKCCMFSRSIVVSQFKLVYLGYILAHQCLSKVRRVQ